MVAGQSRLFHPAQAGRRFSRAVAAAPTRAPAAALAAAQHAVEIKYSGRDDDGANQVQSEPQRQYVELERLRTAQGDRENKYRHTPQETVFQRLPEGLGVHAETDIADHGEGVGGQLEGRRKEFQYHPLNPIVRSKRRRSGNIPTRVPANLVYRLVPRQRLYARSRAAGRV